MFSSGIMGMIATGHPQIQVINPCAVQPASASAGARAAGGNALQAIRAAPAGHRAAPLPASHPRSATTGKAARSAAAHPTRSVTGHAARSGTATATPTPTKTPTHPATPTASPTTTTPSPSPSSSASPSQQPTPTPHVRPTTGPGRLGSLCIQVSTTSRGPFSPREAVGYRVDVWFAASPIRRKPGTERVTLVISAVPRSLSPRFTACHLHGRQICQRRSRTRYTVAGMTPGRVASLSAVLTLPRHSLGKRVTLRVMARASTQRGTGADSFVIHKAQPSPSPSPTPSSTPTLPPLPSGSNAPNALPTLPSAFNPASAFPAISPGSVSLPPGRHVRLVNASATLPLDSRLIGGQVAALALLAAAVTIAVARLTLRQPAAQRKEPPDAT